MNYPNSKKNKIVEITVLGVMLLSFFPLSIRAQENVVSPVCDSISNSSRTIDLERVPSVGATSSILGLYDWLHNDCGEIEIGSNAMVCSVSQTGNIFAGENESIVGSVISFNRDCNVQLVKATVPKYWQGNDTGGAGSVSVRQGEWPSVATMISSNQSGIEIKDDGKTYPTDTTYYSGLQFLTPGQINKNQLYDNDGTESAKVSYKVRASSGNAYVNENEEQEIGTPYCEDSPYNSPGEKCASPVHAQDVAELSAINYHIPVTEGESHFTQRPAETSAACVNPSQEAPGETVCVDRLNLASGFVMNIFGQITWSNILDWLGCKIMGNCYEDVSLVVDMASVLGDNLGGYMNIDEAQDMYLSIQNLPNMNRDTSKSGSGMNSPYWKDSYEYTMGVVNVCGKSVDVPLVWRDWLVDSWRRENAELRPCDPEIDTFCNYTDYRQYVDGVMAVEHTSFSDGQVFDAVLAGSYGHPYGWGSLGASKGDVDKAIEIAENFAARVDVINGAAETLVLVNPVLRQSNGVETSDNFAYELIEKTAEKGAYVMFDLQFASDFSSMKNYIDKYLISDNVFFDIDLEWRWGNVDASEINEIAEYYFNKREELGYTTPGIIGYYLLGANMYKITNAQDLVKEYPNGYTVQIMDGFGSCSAKEYVTNAMIDLYGKPYGGMEFYTKWGGVYEFCTAEDYYEMFPDMSIYLSQ